MSNNTDQNLNTNISENQEPNPREIIIVLNPLFAEFNQVLQIKYGLEDVKVVNFTTIVSSKVVREATESSKTIWEEYNEILRKTGFSDVYKDLEIIDVTIAARSLIRQPQYAFPPSISDDRKEEILSFLKDQLTFSRCKCRNIKNKCIPCPH
ncbi:hypothetical protein [Argonema antarcticum]|uniref:hypothetical protein n=1 Tax=Argonema antarcticum TaxID=2942763 RepID=UPI0020131E80|nr:hypothetical protein [Argonema antarcticum]MCL1470030.1 hypothetical protein [Argonema antarcticum A004/B2]